MTTDTPSSERAIESAVYGVGRHLRGQIFLRSRAVTDAVTGKLRAVSSVISVILLVAVTVVLAAVLSVATLGLAENLDDTAPVISQSDGEFAPQNGFDGGIVRIRHVAGDIVRVSEIEVAVSADCGGDGTEKHGRLVNLPVKSDDRPQSDNIEGDDIFDESTGSLTERGADDTGALVIDEFRPGDVIVFRIAGGDCDLQPGDTVTVRVVHTPSNAVIIQQQLTA
ncbi:type IV pilin [Haloarcula argentinensis]|uniref:Type IV pilin n=1 Tax=Haloarcula argentinensis TaxID=43776 RepID=A0ABU2EWU7_HALAR|nr:type IV pilin [Haloarcula argentinensis]MDS0252755.1 type IV pilin [Haloarcula argentinensis]